MRARAKIVRRCVLLRTQIKGASDANNQSAGVRLEFARRLKAAHWSKKACPKLGRRAFCQLQFREEKVSLANMLVGVRGVH
jgi:hypothetical protein